MMLQGYMEWQPYFLGIGILVLYYFSQVQMEGQIVDVPSEGAIYPQLPTNSSTTIARNNYTFTIPTQTYQRVYRQVILGCMVWLLLGAFSAVCLVQLQLGLDFAPFFIEVAIGFIPINIFIFRTKKHFTKMIRVWFILTPLALLALGIILAIKVNCLGIVLSVYALIQTSASFFILRNRACILIKLLAFLQVIVVGFKEDGLIQSTYSQLSFAMAIFFMFGCLFSLALLLYAIIGSLFSSNPLFLFKRQGLIYIVANILSLCSIISIPLWRAYISDSYMPSLLAASFVCLLSVAYTYGHKQGIVIYMCGETKVEEIKEPPRLQPCSSPYISLFKASSTWMVQSSEASSVVKIQQTQECLACLSRQAEMVWLPCGHCVLCFDCTKNLLAKSRQCPLCKTEGLSFLKLVRKPGLNSQAHPNEVQVGQCFKIIFR